MARSKIWLFIAFLWEQYRRLSKDQVKAIVHAFVGVICFKYSFESRELVTNATLDLIQKLANLIGSASTLLAIINALHKQPKPSTVTPEPTIIGGITHG